MKKRIIALLAAVSMLMFACSSALATEEEFHALLSRIVDPENPVVYTFATLEYGTLSPTKDYDPSWMVKVLGLASLTPALPDETPDGEYVVLNFPEEGIRYDFFFADKEKNYARQVNADNTEELYTVTMPEDVFVTVSDVIMMEAESLAAAGGAAPRPMMAVPEESWVSEGLDGAVWMDDRAALTVYPDVDCFAVTVAWGGSTDASRVWVYLCDYDPETDALKAYYSSCYVIKYDENGESSDVQTLYDGESAASVFLDDQGRVTITDAADALVDGKSFGLVSFPEE